MNNNDPPNKRVCIHNDASSKVTPTPTPVSRKFVNSSYYFVVYDFHLTLVFMFNSNSPTTHRLPLLRKSLLIPSMKSCQSLLVRGVLMK